jgi:hypothetical protein
VRAWHPELILQSERRFNAKMIFEEFGPAAKAAVPELIKLLDDDLLRDRAIVTLGAIGPNGREGQAQLPQPAAQGAYQSTSYVNGSLPALNIEPRRILRLVLNEHSRAPTYTEDRCEQTLRLSRRYALCASFPDE